MIRHPDCQGCKGMIRHPDCQGCKGMIRHPDCQGCKGMIRHPDCQGCKGMIRHPGCTELCMHIFDKTLRPSGLYNYAVCLVLESQLPGLYSY